jgi:hypothetical protein
MTTETDICNRALDVLKEAPITSIDDQRPIGRWLKRNFAVERDALLEEAEWNFALKRASLPADSSPPAFGWDAAYTLPSDCIRLVPLTEDGQVEGRPIPHEVEGGKIFTDAPAPLKVRYVHRSENYATWPATFQKALSARLARGMAHWLTGKTSFLQIADAMYRDAMNSAWLSDAVQGTSPRAADTEWTDAR